MRLKTLLFTLFALGFLTKSAISIGAQGSAFAFQGELTDNSAPANGLYDLQFSFSDALTDGNQIGGSVTNTAVKVKNGLFRVTLDFGLGVFTGPGRWLETAVRASGSGDAYTVLSPRQAVLPIPYASHATSAGTASFAATAAGLTTPLPASQLAGRLSDAQLSANVPLLSGTNRFTGLNNVFDGSVGIGTGTPTAALDVQGTIKASAGIVAGGASMFTYRAPANHGENFFLGRNAGNLTLGSPTDYESSYNTGIGQNSLSSLTQGYWNTGVGANTLSSLTIGYGNTAIGINAMWRTKMGDANVAIGGGALSANTTGSDNVANGYQAMFSNTTGFGNVAVGVYALWNNKDGFANTAVGRGTLNLNTDGYSNTAIGANVMQSNTSGNRNTGVGDSSLFYNTTGVANVAMGDAAMENNITGSANTGIGHASLYYNSSGYGNAALGESTLRNNLSGSNNVAIGLSALRLNQSGTDNIGIGRLAGYGQSNENEGSTVDKQMVFIGGLATRTGTSTSNPLTNGIAIGFGAQVDRSNKAVIGNDAITTTVLKGNVGIGTSSPTTALDVKGTITADHLAGGGAAGTITFDPTVIASVSTLAGFRNTDTRMTVAVVWLARTNAIPPDEAVFTNAFATPFTQNPHIMVACADRHTADQLRASPGALAYVDTTETTPNRFVFRLSGGDFGKTAGTNFFTIFIGE